MSFDIVRSEDENPGCAVLEWTDVERYTIAGTPRTTLEEMEAAGEPITAERVVSLVLGDVANVDPAEVGWLLDRYDPDYVHVNMDDPTITATLDEELGAPGQEVVQEIRAHGKEPRRLTEGDTFEIGGSTVTVTSQDNGETSA
jgi:hypothetical protein